jgi:hypothetical protein
MATHDYIVSNGTGSVIRADINNALAAIVSNNSSSSEPATKYAYMWWADTSAGLLKIRNSANDAWITLFQLDGTLTLEDGSNSAPAISFRDDTNTGIFSSAADNLDITTGGTTRVNVSSAGINVTGTVTDDGASHDGDVTFTGASANIIFDKSDNALEFADNAKALFGNSGDLAIHHDGSNSFVDDTGTGVLRVRGSEVLIQKTSSTENMFRGVADGAVELFHNNVKHFETTSTGVTVTGALRTTGDINIQGTYPNLQFIDTNHDSDYRLTNADGIFLLFDITNAAIRLQVPSSGDIQIPSDSTKLQLGASQDLELYHDGTNSYLDNSTGITFLRNTGTNGSQIQLLSDNSGIKIQGKTGEQSIVVDANGGVDIYFDNTKRFETTSTGIDVTGAITGTGDLTIDTNTLHVDSSNNRVGIGTTSPSSLLHVSGTGIPTIKLEDTDTAGGYAHFEVNGAALFIESYDEDGTTGQIIFKNATTEAMRISESGNLGIGTTSPTYPLEVHTASGDAQIKLMTSGTGASDDTVLRSQIGGTSGNNYIFFGDDDDANAGQIRYSHASDAMYFTANAAERMRILSSGGITFNGDTATANALDDYEEGVFTPSLEFGGATTGITYSSMRGGSYVKIGRQVTVNFGFTLTSKGSASGDATIAGLPYAVEDLLSATSVEASGVSSFWNDVATDSANIVFAALGGTSELELRNTVGAEDDTDAMVDSDFDNDSAIRGSITYFTAT